MEYVFLLYNEEFRWNTMTEETSRREVGAYQAYTAALREAGVLVGGNRLEPSGAATTIRLGNDGKAVVLDGPYPDTKEQLGGFFIVDVPDLDAALAWAARCPCASHGIVEVRPVGEVPVPA